MNHRTDEYREKAEYCEDMARKARTMDQRAAWLKLASHWRELIARYSPQSAPHVLPARNKTDISRPENSSSSAAGVPWYAERFFAEMSDCEHFVQLYETDKLLIDTVVSFVAGAFAAGDAAVVIATPDHMSALVRQLICNGTDVAARRQSGQFVCQDAQETLNSVMVQGWPDDLQFTNTIGASLRPARGAGERKVRVFDEMVAILWAGGYDAATIRLEKFWHEACHQQGFALFCAYPRVCFPAGPSEPMSRVLATHSKVLVG